jgi:ABC-type polysaccharide/polyol phosphate export permease
MEALKWFGYIVAAIVMLSVVLGLGMFVAAVVATVGAIAFLVAAVMAVAALIRSFCKEVL